MFGFQEENQEEKNCDEREDLENEIESIKILSDKLYNKMRNDLSKEEHGEVFSEIADKRTTIKDVECMIAELK